MHVITQTYYQKQYANPVLILKSKLFGLVYRNLTSLKKPVYRNRSNLKFLIYWIVGLCNGPTVLQTTRAKPNGPKPIRPARTTVRFRVQEPDRTCLPHGPHGQAWPAPGWGGWHIRPWPESGHGRDRRRQADAPPGIPKIGSPRVPISDPTNSIIIKNSKFDNF